MKLEEKLNLEILKRSRYNVKIAIHLHGILEENLISVFIGE